jgi:hypothetical protein
MEEYRAYFVGHDGHFSGFEPIVCAVMRRQLIRRSASSTGTASRFGAVRGLSAGLSLCGSRDNHHPMIFTRPTQAENTTTTTAMKRRPR